MAGAGGFELKEPAAAVGIGGHAVVPMGIKRWVARLDRLARDRAQLRQAV